MTELTNKTLEELKSADIAATKIQAGFRGYQVRKKLQEEREKVKKDCVNGVLVVERTSDKEEENSEDHMVCNFFDNYFLKIMVLGL